MSEDEMLNSTRKHNIWTWSSQANPSVIHIDRAEGVYFWDFNQKRYLDFNSTTMCVNIGHGNRHVQEAMIRQISELPVAGPHMITRPRALLCQKLATITPAGLDHYLFTLGGADANENAIKFARDFTGKFKILTRYRSYHGATMGAMALTGDRRRLHWEPGVMPGVVHFMDPYPYRSPLHKNGTNITDEQLTQIYLDQLEEMIHYEGPETVAAILLETVTGTNGILIPPVGYLQGIRRICDKYGILLVCDEVMCGFGRTGKWFAFEHWGVVPDIITMAKGITSGYAPLGAVAIKKEIADFYNERTFFGGLTYNAHPLSMAAALANIEVIEQEDLLHRATLQGETLSRLLKDLMDRHACVGEVRSIGLFGAIELVKDKATREPLTPHNGPLSAIMKKILSEIDRQGVYLHNNFNILLIIPPLIITEQQLREGLAVIDAALTFADEALASG